MVLLSSSELSKLAVRCQKKIEPYMDEDICKWLLSNVMNKKEDVNEKIVVNFFISLTLLELRREMLHESGYSALIGLYKEAILECIFR